jgi:hypothetical protein
MKIQIAMNQKKKASSPHRNSPRFISRSLLSSISPGPLRAEELDQALPP